MATAVAFPIDVASLLPALDAATAGLIVPMLIGPAAQIQAVAKTAGADITALRLIDVPDGPAAAAQAVALARAGMRHASPMKGDLHTEDLMHAVVAAQTGLRTRRRISHVYLMDVPDYPRPLLVTDAAINITPSTRGQGQQGTNAIDLRM